MVSARTPFPFAKSFAKEHTNKDTPDKKKNKYNNNNNMVRDHLNFKPEQELDIWEISIIKCY